MGEIKEMRLVEASKAADYREALGQAIDELQGMGLQVDVQHSMSQAQKGVGYMYSAVVTGRFVPAG